ncbi:MAG: hypothetical protein EBQ89_11340 [Alphaproteobacteria bacterium]|nr:hypothetical protein [Alphaproteobacteria bacterium]
MTIFIVFFTSSHAHPPNNDVAIEKLQPVVLSDGVNQLTWQGLPLVIVRGIIPSETAAGGDAYTVLLKPDRQNTEWQTVPLDDGTVPTTDIRTIPHTEIDSLQTLRWLAKASVDKNKKNQQKNHQVFQNIYLLRARRAQIVRDGHAFGPSAVTFQLFELQKNEGFDFYHLRMIDAHTTTKIYCNADWAVWEIYHLQPIAGPLGNNDCQAMSPIQSLNGPQHIHANAAQSSTFHIWI